MKRLGLYIHIPFCERKCHYCDFVSFAGMQHSFERYIDAVLAEADLHGSYFKDHTVDTLFIGGGTPSLLSPQLIKKLMSGLGGRCNLHLREATIEANPESLSEEKLAAYKDCGISRLSIGMQTHDDGILKYIGRGHTFERFLSAFESAEKYFGNINADTIFSLPGQTPQSFKATLKHIISLPASHVSAYSLKLEQGTKLAECFSGADEDIDRDMYHSAVSLLEDAGYMQYETSNFAKTGCECIHNLKYWLGEEYLGLGVAAHSFAFEDVKKRFSNTEYISEYIEAVTKGIKPTAQTSSLSVNDEINEYIMLRLRLKRGISYLDFNCRFNMVFEEVFKQPIRIAKRAELITEDESGIYPTLRGFDLQNALILEFMKII